MYFVVEFAESEGIDAIRVVRDRFTKVEDYLPGKSTCPAVDVANTYIYDICPLNVLPQHITSDRDPAFAYKFSKELNCKLKINPRLSTADHPQTYELSE